MQIHLPNRLMSAVHPGNFGLRGDPRFEYWRRDLFGPCSFDNRDENPGAIRHTQDHIKRLAKSLKASGSKAFTQGLCRRKTSQ
jgi:hypothetical protein